MTGNTGDTGNTGNTGDTGNTGNSGGAGIQGEFGGGWFIEDRSDFPFVSADDPSGAALDPQRLNLAITSFTERAWTARWWAFLVLHDFATSGWKAAADPKMNAEWATIVSPPTGELNGLVNDHKNERAPAMGEILSQDVEFNTDFMALLSITPASHPNTYRVMHIASQIASYAALYYKGQRQRIRPSQLLPALLPPVPMPGHSSWPSGHATQAWLKALCLEFVLTGSARAPGTAMTGLPPNPITGPSATPIAVGTMNLGVISANLRALAMRIARNREIAGLHYPTDSQAGRVLADAIFPTLTAMMTPVPSTWFRKAVDAARLEWT